MSKPEGIPDSILEAAMGALKAARPLYESDEQYDAHWLSVSRAILAAVEEEREACAQIAEGRKPLYDNHPHGYVGVNALREAANSIRNRKGN